MTGPDWANRRGIDYLKNQRHAEVLFVRRGPLEFVVEAEVRRYTVDDATTLDVIVAYRPGSEPLIIAPIAVHLLDEYFSAARD